MYERDRMEVERRNAQLREILFDDYRFYGTVQYKLPSLQQFRGTNHYKQAMSKIVGMLNGKTPLNLKQAVFAVENAFFEGTADLNQFNEWIARLVAIAKQKAIEGKYDWNDSMTKKVLLFRVLADTLRVKLPGQERHTTSYPMEYDFDDFWAEKDWTKMFVTKLLATHKGQCHSLPLLYLILCEEVGAEAYLAYSPSHSYIKIKDEADNWYNLELTNKHTVTDAFIIGSGFITAEALRSKTYMEPQNKRQVISQCLSDLSSGYIKKYGYDEFVVQCTDSVFKYDPQNLAANINRANYETILFEYMLHQTGILHPDTFKVKHPPIYETLQRRNTLYRKIDAMGYRSMPKEAYKGWLQDMNKEKEDQEYNEKYNKPVRLE
jgi:hypothetical protein